MNKGFYSFSYKKPNTDDEKDKFQFTNYGRQRFFELDGYNANSPQNLFFDVNGYPKIPSLGQMISVINPSGKKINLTYIDAGVLLPSLDLIVNADIYTQTPLATSSVASVLEYTYQAAFKYSCVNKIDISMENSNSKSLSKVYNYSEPIYKLPADHQEVPKINQLYLGMSADGDYNFQSFDISQDTRFYRNRFLDDRVHYSKITETSYDKNGNYISKYIRSYQATEQKLYIQFNQFIGFPWSVTLTGNNLYERGGLICEELLEYSGNGIQTPRYKKTTHNYNYQYNSLIPIFFQQNKSETAVSFSLSMNIYEIASPFGIFFFDKNRYSTTTQISNDYPTNQTLTTISDERFQYNKQKITKSAKFISKLSGGDQYSVNELTYAFSNDSTVQFKPGNILTPVSQSVNKLVTLYGINQTNINNSIVSPSLVTKFNSLTVVKKILVMLGYFNIEISLDQLNYLTDQEKTDISNLNYLQVLKMGNSTSLGTGGCFWPYCNVLMKPYQDGYNDMGIICNASYDSLEVLGLDEFQALHLVRTLFSDGTFSGDTDGFQTGIKNYNYFLNRAILLNNNVFYASGTITDKSLTSYQINSSAYQTDLLYYPKKSWIAKNDLASSINNRPLNTGDWKQINETQSIDLKTGIPTKIKHFGGEPFYEFNYFGNESSPASSGNDFGLLTKRGISNNTNGYGSGGFYFNASYNNKRQLISAAMDIGNQQILNYSFKFDRDSRITSKWKGNNLLDSMSYFNSRLGNSTGFQDNSPNTYRKLSYSDPSIFNHTKIYYDGFGEKQTELYTNATTSNNIILKEPVYDNDYSVVGQIKPVYKSTSVTPQFSASYFVGEKVGKAAVTEAPNDVAAAYNGDNYPFGFTVKTLLGSSYTLPEGQVNRDNKRFNGTLIEYNSGYRFIYNVDENRKNITVNKQRLNGITEESYSISNSLYSINGTNLDINSEQKVLDSMTTWVHKTLETSNYSAENIATNPGPGIVNFTINAGDILRLSNITVQNGNIAVRPFSSVNTWIQLRKATGENIITYNSPSTVSIQDFSSLSPGNYILDVYREVTDYGLNPAPTSKIKVDIFRLGSTNVVKSNKVIYTYDEKLHLTTITHPNGTKTKYRYDYFGNIVKKETPDHEGKIYVTSIAEDSVEVNPDFQYAYDIYGRLLYAVDPNQSVSTVPYLNGKMTYYIYDWLNRLTETGEVAFDQTKFTGNMLDATAMKTPDNANYLIRSTYDGATTTDIYFETNNAKGMLSKKSERVSRFGSSSQYITTYYSYTPEGWLKKITESNPGYIKEESFLGYDLQGKLLEYKVTIKPTLFVNSDILQHRWITYDGFGRTSSIKISSTDIPPSVPSVSYLYNADGSVKQTIFGNGVQSVDYSYNIRGWLTDINNRKTLGTDKFAEKLNYWDNLPVGISPNYNGNISAIYESNFTGNTGNSVLDSLKFGFSYDNLNRLTSANSYSNQTSTNNLFNTDYTYDVMGNILTLNRKSEVGYIDQFSYKYQANRLMQLTDAAVTAADSKDYKTKAPGNDIAFDALFNENFEGVVIGGTGNWSNGTSTVSQVTIVTTSTKQLKISGLNLPFSGFENSVYSKNIDVVEGATYKLSGYGYTNTYTGFFDLVWKDNSDNIITTTINNFSVYGDPNRSYTLTAPAGAKKVAIRLRIKLYTINDYAQFDNIKFEEKTPFDYDNNGNLVQDANRSISDITYNNFNLPILIKKSNSDSVWYAYNESGQRIMKKTRLGAVKDSTYYVRDFSGNTIAEFRKKWHVDSLNYVNYLGNGSEVIGKRYKESGVYKEAYYLKDHLGNIRTTVWNNSGTPVVISAQDYYPFGSTLREYNAGSVEANKFKYQGKERDIESGYDYFEARLYDSQLGRFMQVDPHSAFYNNITSYSGMNNNPLKMIDPDGRDWYEFEYKDKDGNAKKSVLWKKGDSKSISIGGDKYKNIGANYTHTVGKTSYYFEQDKVTKIVVTLLKNDQWVSQLGKNGKSEMQCLTAANKMLSKDGVSTSDGGKQILTMKVSNDELVATDDSKHAEGVMDEMAFGDNKPFIVGVNYNNQTDEDSGNKGGITDHWVAIAKAIYDVKNGTTTYQFFDPGRQNESDGTRSGNILKKDSDGIWKGNTGKKDFGVSSTRPNN